MDVTKLKETIQKRKELDPNDDFPTKDCWDEEIDILTEDIDDAINFIKTCTEEEFYWLSEVFDDVISKTQSQQLYQAMVDRNEALENPEYKESNKTDLFYAKEALNQ